MPPFQLMAITFGIGGLAGVALWSVRPAAAKALRQPWQVWLLGVGGLFGYHAAYFFALRNAPVVEAGLLNYLWPLLIVIFSALLPGERLKWQHIVGSMLALAGVAMGAYTVFAVGLNVTKRMRLLPPLPPAARFVILGVVIAFGVYVATLIERTPPATTTAEPPPKVVVPVPDLDDQVLAGARDSTREERLVLEAEPLRHLLAKAIDVGPTVAAALGMPETPIAVPEVRTRITDLQRAIAAGAEKGIVVEGRDIGTTVLPDADLKIFLTASPEARAARRSGELKGADVAATKEALIKRDAADSGRKTSPLAKADDAVEVDTTELTLQQVIECVVTLVEEKRAAK